MDRFNFTLKNNELIDNMRSPAVYEFNLAQNLALLSDDVSVIRRFYEVQVPKYFKDTRFAQEASNKFLAQYIPGQAFTYFGLIPMIVKAKINLVASKGFVCQSNDMDIDRALNVVIGEAELLQKFCDGVYWESGIGDVAFRISYCPNVCEKPIIDIIEPQRLEVDYKHGKIKSFVVKEVSQEDPSYELRETHYKDEQGYVNIEYRFAIDGKYISLDDEALFQECKEKFPPDTKLTSLKLPLKDFLIIFKKNDNANKLYNGERGVPDIQGLASIEDALTESISDLIDAIRKGGVKEFVSDELIPQDENGNDMLLNHFNKTVITTKGSLKSENSSALWSVVQNNINWEMYTRTIQNLMSVAINKAGLSPTTLGLLGLVINSSAESQDACEKLSVHTREIALNGWRRTLKDLLNRYLQVCDYLDGKEINEYCDLINITFGEYFNPKN